jgi:hypothetical protein
MGANFEALSSTSFSSDRTSPVALMSILCSQQQRWRRVVLALRAADHIAFAFS